MSLVQTTVFDLSECTLLLSRYPSMKGVDLTRWYRNFFTALPRNARLDHADYLAAVTDAMILAVAVDGPIDYHSTVAMASDVCDMLDSLVDQIDHWIELCQVVPLIESIDFVRVTRTSLTIEHHHRSRPPGEPV